WVLGIGYSDRGSPDPTPNTEHGRVVCYNRPLSPRAALVAPVPNKALINIHELLELAIRHRASDLLLKAGSAPALRIDGTIATTRMPPLTAPEMQELARSVVYTASRDDLLRSFYEYLQRSQNVHDVAE